MNLKDGLTQLIQDFGKSPYNNCDISEMKKHINEVLGKCGETAPQRALIKSFQTKLLNKNDRNEILLMLSDKMFALAGQGI